MQRWKIEENLIQKLKKYFDGKKEIAFAFLFGSYARGNANKLSDVDIAVYFYPEKRHPLEYEEEIFYDSEDEIWADIERNLKKEVELLVLNRAPATVAGAAIRGIPLAINDWGLYLDFMEVITEVAEDFMNSVIENYRTREALKRETKIRLIRHITFLENELKDYKSFKILSWEEYNKERNKRRNVERWIENIVNSSVDIAKIILTAENIPIPETYREIVYSLSLIAGFDKKSMKNLSRWVKLRNIISHEYLDIRWSSIKKFVTETEPLYTDFLHQVKNYLEKKIAEDRENT